METYTLPYRFIELQKQCFVENDERDKHLTWIVHDETNIYETIKPRNQVLSDFNHFKREDYSSGARITRVLQNPLCFRGSVCQVSVYVWINNMNPFESYIYSEPFLTLLQEPEVLNIKSVFDGKYSYKQVMNGLRKDMNDPNLHKKVWDDLCKNTAYALLILLIRFSRNKNSMNLIEFKYILEKDTIKPYLADINSDVQFHSQTDNIDEYSANPSNTKSKYVSQYKDMKMSCLLHRCMSKVEQRLHEIKYKEYGKRRTDRFSMLYELSKVRHPKSLSPMRDQINAINDQELSQSLDRVINDVIRGNDTGSK